MTPKILLFSLAALAVVVDSHVFHQHAPLCKETLVMKLMKCLVPFSVECSMEGSKACFTYDRDRTEHSGLLTCLTTEFNDIPLPCILKCVTENLVMEYGAYCIARNAIDCSSVCITEKAAEPPVTPPAF